MGSEEGRWGAESYLVEVKAGTGRGKVYVGCPREEGGGDEGEVKVEQDGLSLQLPSRILHSPRLLGLSLRPETLHGFAWASNHTLFTASILATTTSLTIGPPPASSEPGFHAGVEGSENSFILSRLIRGSASLDEFTRTLNREGGSVVCAHCSEPLIPTIEGLGIARSLPSDDWVESGVGEDVGFFCHGHGDEEDSAAIPSFDADQHRDGVRLSDSHFLVSAHNSLDSLSLDCFDKILRCQHCAAQIGLLLTVGSQKLYKLFHSGATLTPHGHESFLGQRFSNEEKYLAWLTLAKCHESGSLKILLRTLDGRAKILIWLLDSYTLVATGRLGPGTESVEPALTLQLLFKLYSDSDSPGEEDWSVYEVRETEALLGRLSRVLLSSSQRLPPPVRSLGLFLHGALPIAPLSALLHSSS